MDSDGPWQTLQLHLRSARAAREAGNVSLALQEVDAALSIDPDYLAARVLRESIAHPQPAGSPQQTSAPATLSQPERQLAEIAATEIISLEERARRRRIEQRISAARTAIRLRQFAEARAALEELVELDPALPAIPEIETELDAACAPVKRKRSLLLAGLAAAVVGMIVGALAGLATQTRRQLPGSVPVGSLSANAMAMFSVSTPGFAPTLSAELFDPAAAAAATSDANAPVRADSAPSSAAPALRPRIQTPSPIAERLSEAAAVAERPSPVPVPAAERPIATPAPVERAPEAPPTDSPRADRPSEARAAVASDDPALIRDTLQRYRRAYNALDARLAHAVYPGVDEVALTRAFEGLRSQSLEFETCSVDARAESAHAVCHGSARYVPRVGSREPRAESLVWTFRLKKSDGDWTIESAWTNR